MTDCDCNASLLVDGLRADNERLRHLVKEYIDLRARLVEADELGVELDADQSVVAHAGELLSNEVTP